MLGEPWFFGAMLALIALQALTLVVSYWRGTGPFAATDSEPEVTSAGGAVLCPDCGAENVPEYRFCRHCVTELPGGISSSSPRTAVFGRGSR